MWIFKVKLEMIRFSFMDLGNLIVPLHLFAFRSTELIQTFKKQDL